MRVETEFWDEHALFNEKFRLSVVLDGRPEYVEIALRAVREALGKVERVSEKKR